MTPPKNLATSSRIFCYLGFEKGISKKKNKMKADTSIEAMMSEVRKPRKLLISIQNCCVFIVN